MIHICLALKITTILEQKWQQKTQAEAITLKSKDYFFLIILLNDNPFPIQESHFKILTFCASVDPILKDLSNGIWLIQRSIRFKRVLNSSGLLKFQITPTLLKKFNSLWLIFQVEERVISRDSISQQQTSISVWNMGNVLICKWHRKIDLSRPSKNIQCNSLLLFLRPYTQLHNSNLGRLNQLAPRPNFNVMKFLLPH